MGASENIGRAIALVDVSGRELVSRLKLTRSGSDPLCREARRLAIAAAIEAVTIAAAAGVSLQRKPCDVGPIRSIESMLLEASGLIAAAAQETSSAYPDTTLPASLTITGSAVRFSELVAKLAEIALSTIPKPDSRQLTLV